MQSIQNSGGGLCPTIMKLIPSPASTNRMIYFFYLKKEIKDFVRFYKWDDNKAYVKITPKTKYKVTLNKNIKFIQNSSI